MTEPICIHKCKPKQFKLQDPTKCSRANGTPSLKFKQQFSSVKPLLSQKSWELEAKCLKDFEDFDHKGQVILILCCMGGCRKVSTDQWSECKSWRTSSLVLFSHMQLRIQSENKRGDYLTKPVAWTSQKWENCSVTFLKKQLTSPFLFLQRCLSISWNLLYPVHKPTGKCEQMTMKNSEQRLSQRSGLTKEAISLTQRKLPFSWWLPHSLNLPAG